MSRTWIVAYWMVAAVAMFRLVGHRPAPVQPNCATRRTEYRVSVLGVEWVKSVRETPMAGCRTVETVETDGTLTGDGR